mmetsp:Transcript_17830/g.17906  ORF Transcript_17830/g.17906 Transcript_17830/m.17906 type:complete len:246 (+) Transcript_17830:2-739(+)
MFMNECLTQNSSNTKRELRSSSTPSKQLQEDFCVETTDWLLSALTRDHTCESHSERLAVSHLTSDPSPYAQSANDKRKYGRLAITRVAGSLAVTRAFGDGYLKLKELSKEPFAKHVPYITARPTVCYAPVSSGHTALVLASDGLWNYVSAEEVLSILTAYLDSVDCSTEECVSSVSSIKSVNRDIVVTENMSNDDVNIAKLLIDRCLENAAIALGQSVSYILAMQPGPTRRRCIDDVTVMVLLFS